MFLRSTNMLVVAFALTFCATGVIAEDKAEADKPSADAKTSDSHDAKPHDSHSAGGHGEHHPHVGLDGANADPAEFRSDLAIYTFVIFLLLLAILGKFAWGPITAGLDNREKRIADNIAAAQASQEEAKKMLAEYEKKLAAAHDEVRGIIDEARRDAEQTHQDILARAREDAAAEIARGKHEIETATAAALKQLAEESANVAVNLAGKIISTKLNPSEHSQLVTEALSKFASRTPSHN